MRTKEKEKERRKSVLAREEEELKGRYHDLYGEGRYEEALRRHRRKRRGDILLLTLLFVTVLGYSLYLEFRPIPGARFSGENLVAVARPAEGSAGEQVNARLYVVREGKAQSEERTLYISPVKEAEEEAPALLGEEEEEQSLKRHIDQAIRQANARTEEEEVLLPTELEDGTRLVWRPSRRHSLPLLALLLGAGLFYLYRSRFAEIEKEEKEARESVIRELPEFLHRLTLLLHAGVVLDVAFARALEGMGEESYFGGQMHYLSRRSRETKSSLPEEFRHFAKRSGVRELMRIAAILEDHRQRGADLVSTLRQENRLFWFERKKQSEEKGRIAETKLTMPLAILLLVLVLVTVAPALFEM